MGEMVQPVDPTRIPVVRERDGKLFADSRDVAAFFEKRHEDVLRAIRGLHCSHEFTTRNFALREEIQKHSTGASRSTFVEMTRSGFVFLVMGFTGERAAEFKERYINRFDAMERELQARQKTDVSVLLNDPAALRGLLGSYAERVENLEFQIGEMAPKVQSFDRLVTAHGSVCITDAAKQLQVPPSELFRWLRTHNWLFKRGGADVPYQSRIALGYLEAKTTTVQRSDGTDRIVVQARITAKGLARLAGEFEGAPRLL